MKQLKKMVEELTNLQGNVGYEEAIIEYILSRKKIRDISTKVDSLGNITIHLTPHLKEKNKPKVMLFGHSDEVGMMVKRIDNEGFIYVEKLGSVNPTCLPGLKVQVAGDKGTIDGVVGVKSHHLLQGNDKNHVATVQNIYIDLGAKNRKSVIDSGVNLGSPVSFKPQFMELLDDCVSNKSMDDRALLAILIYLSETLDPMKLKCDTYIVISVQEEFNTRGIMPTVREINPNYVVGLDVTPATDTPDLNGYSEIYLGNGPALTYMNHHSRGTLAGIVPNRKYINYITELAEGLGVNIQREIATGILTETAYIAVEHVDCVVANFSLPTRYTHTPVEVICMNDLEDMTKVLEKFAYDIDETKRFGKNFDVLRKEDN